MALVLMSACWFAWYVARERYHLTTRQLAELATYLIIVVLAVVGARRFCGSRDDPGEKGNGRILLCHIPET